MSWSLNLTGSLNRIPVFCGKMLTKPPRYITSIVYCTILVIYHAGLVNIFPQNTKILFKLISESLFIAVCSVDECAKEKRTEFNCMLQ